MKKILRLGQVKWLTPIIPATLETDSWKIKASPEKISETQSQQTNLAWWCAPTIQAMWET
jgi:hypothetical protein